MNLKACSPVCLSITLLLSSAAAKADLVFDNFTSFENGDPNAHVSVTSSTPNTFMGGAYNLLTGTTAITGFDVYPANISGSDYTGLKINIFVWGSVNTSGTVNATTPAFGNLLGSYSLTSSGTFTTGYYYSFDGTPVGVNPGITLTTPLAISSPTIGLTFNIQGTTDGVNYSSVNTLTTLIKYGVTPDVGSEVFNGYYRNAANEVNGNFTSSLRSLGQQNQSLAVRVYGVVVPEPTTLALAGLGALALVIRRRQ